MQVRRRLTLSGSTICPRVPVRVPPGRHGVNAAAIMHGSKVTGNASRCRLTPESDRAPAPSGSPKPIGGRPGTRKILRKLRPQLPWRHLSSTVPRGRVEFTVHRDHRSLLELLASIMRLERDSVPRAASTL